jgi:hypothetical protein
VPGRLEEGMAVKATHCLLNLKESLCAPPVASGAVDHPPTAALSPLLPFNTACPLCFTPIALVTMALSSLMDPLSLLL